MEININVSIPDLSDAIRALAAVMGAGKVINIESSILAAPEKEGQKTEPASVDTETKEAHESTIEEEKEVPTMEAVRAKLSAIAQAGKQAQVKELLIRFGAKKLTEVSSDKYTELLTAAEAL